MKVISFVGAMVACASGASAFVTPSFSRNVLSTPKASVCMMSSSSAPKEMSASIPFLEKPKNLDGMVGDVGFDPLGLAEKFPIKFLREGELKNGRVAMLAVVGWIVSEVVRLPGPVFSAENPLDAMGTVGPGLTWIVFFFIGFIEAASHNGKMAMGDMHEDGHVPGDFGLDPLKLSEKPAEVRERYQLQELKHGRLAMFAFWGLVVQSIKFGEIVPLHSSFKLEEIIPFHF